MCSSIIAILAAAQITIVAADSFTPDMRLY